MTSAAVRGVVRRLGPTADAPTDSELVTAFATRRDQTAFAELLRRHGPLVLGACRRVLGESHDAEDAFQAVFLVLARKAETIRPAGGVGGWLYGVAVRTANKARVAAIRRRRREMNAATTRANPDLASREPERPESSVESAELRAILDAELARLPEALRAALVLCDLHGKTRAEAAVELGCPEGTVAARVHRARKKLADALIRRGLALPAAGIAAVLSPAPVSGALTQTTLAVASGAASAAVLALAREVIRSMTTTTHAIAVGVLTLLAGGLLAAGLSNSPEPNAPGTAGSTGFVAPDPAPPPPAGEQPKQPVSPWREAKVLDHDGWLVGSVAYSPNGKALYVGGTDGHVRAYDTATMKPIWDYKRGGGKLAAVAAAPDGKTVGITFAATGKQGVQFLDAATGKAGEKVEEEHALANWPEPLAVAFFPDTPILDGGRMIATSRKVIFGNPRQYVVKLWLEWPKVSTIKSSTVAAGKQPADEYAVPLATSPDGKRVVVTGPVDPDSGKNVLWAWSAGSGAGNELLLGHKAAVTSATWSQDGKVIVTGDAGGVVVTWDAATFKEKSRVAVHGRIAAVAVNADNSPVGELQGKLLRRPEPGVVEINLGSDAGIPPGQTFIVLPSDFPEKGPQSRMRKMRVPDEGGKFKEVEQFVEKASIEVVEVLGPNLSRCKITKEFDPIRDGAAVGDLLYKPFAARGTDYHVAAAVVSQLEALPGKEVYAEEVFVWDAANPPAQPKAVSRPTAGGPFKGVASLAFSPDGKSLASGFCNLTHLARTGELIGKVRIFSLVAEKPEPAATPGEWKERGVLTHHAGPVDSVAFAPDGKSFVSGGADGRVFLWDADKLKPQELGAVIPAGKFTAVAFSPDGKLVAATRDKVTGFFDPEKRQTVQMRPNFPGGRAVAFSADGKYVATSNGFTTEVRRVPPGDGIGEPKELARATDKLPAAVAWSPDGGALAYLHPTENGRTVVGVWEFSGAERQQKDLAGPEASVLAVAWSKDGKLLASGGSDGTVLFWDGRTFKEVRRARFVGRDGGPTDFHGLAFSPDGRTLAAAVTLGTGKSTDRVLLIDTETGKWSDNLFPPTGCPIRSVAFAPDGKALVAACGIDRGKLKPLMTPDEMREAGAVVVWERKP